MADKKLYGGIDSTARAPVQELWHDNGDGTYSRVHWIGATISATIGDLQIPDGQDVAEGATTDDAVTGDTAGSLSAKLRGLNKVLGTIADAAWSSGSGSAIALLKAIAGLLAHGSATSANSVPVVIASDQAAVAVTPPAPTTFKTATATASGDTAVWTPTSGKKFKLMRLLVQVTADAAQASGGDLAIALRDATTAVGITLSVFVPGTAGTAFAAGYSSGWLDVGSGILSAAANNVLNVNLSAALTAGTVRVIAAGIEV